jgi:hypothetical protein
LRTEKNSSRGIKGLFEAPGSRSSFDRLSFSHDEIQIPAVDDETKALPQDKNRVFSLNRIDQQQRAPDNAQCPERFWDNGFLIDFRIDPLNQKPHGEKKLTQQANYKPNTRNIRENFHKPGSFQILMEKTAGIFSL